MKRNLLFFILFSLLAVRISGQNDPFLTIHPKVPAVFDLRYRSPERSDLHIKIANGKGHSLYEEEHQGFEGEYRRELDMRRLKNGVYFVQIVAGRRYTVKKIVVKK